jgi:hypothetical protein
MLKNSFSKGGAMQDKKGDKATNVSTTSAIKQIQDVEKLKLNINQVCDKFSKGAHLDI